MITIFTYLQQNSAAPQYWVASFTNVNNLRMGIQGTSALICGNRNITGRGADGTVVKITENGEVETQASIGGPDSDFILSASSNSAAAPIYGMGYSSGSTVAAFSNKFTTSGDLVWSKKFSLASSNTYFVNSTIDSDGNIYGAGYYSSNPVKSLLVKMDPNGAYLFGRVWTHASLSVVLHSVTRGAAGHIYAVGKSYIGSYTHTFIVKLDTTGNQLAIRQISATSGTHIECRSIAYDPLNDCAYVSGVYTNGSGQKSAHLFKFTNAGVLAWQRTAPDGTSTSSNASYVAVDASGFVYLAAGTNIVPGRSNSTLLTKFDPNGTVVFSHTMSATSAALVNPFGIEVVGSTIFLGINTVGDSCLFKLPSNGTFLSNNLAPAPGGGDFTYAANGSAFVASIHNTTTNHGLSFASISTSNVDTGYTWSNGDPLTTTTVNPIG